MSEQRNWSQDDIDQLMEDTGYGNDPLMSTKENMALRARFTQSGGRETAMVVGGFREMAETGQTDYQFGVMDYVESRYRLVEPGDEPLSTGSQQIYEMLQAQRDSLKQELEREVRKLRGERESERKQEVSDKRRLGDIYSKEEIEDTKLEYEEQGDREGTLNARLLNLMLLDDSQLETTCRAMREGSLVLTENPELVRRGRCYP